MKKTIKTIWKYLHKPIEDLDTLIIIMLVATLIIVYLNYKGDNDSLEWAAVTDTVGAEESAIDDLSTTSSKATVTAYVPLITTINEYNDCTCEETFEEPIDIVWTGEVMTFMMSGEAFAIKRVPENEEYSMFFACCLDEEKRNPYLKGTVTITGKWLGITCAYANTVFGQCAPDVEIEKID